jgi:hypothetical protein
MFVFNWILSLNVKAGYAGNAWPAGVDGMTPIWCRLFDGFAD